MGHGYSANLERLDPRNVVLMRQHLRSSQIEQMLLRHGFEQRHWTGGSHATWANTEFPDLTFVLQHRHGSNNSNVDNQKDAAKICITVIERREAALAAKKKSLTQTFQTESRAPTINDGKVDTLQNLPKHMEAIQKDGFLIVRHRAVPCVGTVAANREFPATLKSTFDQINDRTEAFLKMLKQAEEDFELKITIELDGTWVVGQHTYGIGHKFRPFEPEHSIRLRDDLQGFCSYLKSWDENYAARIKMLIEDALESGDAKSREVDGRIEWRINRSHFLTGEQREMKFIATKNYRINPLDYWGLQEEVFNFDLGPRGDRNYLKKILNHKFGAKMERPKNPATGEPGDKVICSHLIYTDLKCEIPATSELPGVKKLWSAYMAEKDPDKTTELYVQLSDAVEAYTAAFATIDDFTDKLVERMQLEMENVNVVMAAAGKIGFQKSYSPRNVRAGETMDIIFSHPQISTAVRIPAVRLNDNGDIARLSDIMEKLWPVVLGPHKPMPTSPSDHISTIAPWHMRDLQP